MPINHTFVSTKDQSADSSIVSKDEWNADHDVTFLDMPEDDAPATPDSGYARIYVKSDGRVYSKDDGGVEYGPFDAAGGGGPLLYVDSLDLHASGDDFTDASGTGWTFGGTGFDASHLAAVTTEPYDDTCVDIDFSDGSARYLYKTLSGIGLSDNLEVILTTYGVTAPNQMMGLFITNDAGTGTGISWYNNAAAVWAWSLTNYGWAGSLSQILGYFPPPGMASSNMVGVFKIRKVGSSITTYISYDGGLRYASYNRTDATTHTRVGIGSFYTGGGAGSKLRVGRFNIVSV